MMKVQVIVVGRTNKAYLKEAMNTYQRRLERYCEIEVVELADVKKTSSWPRDRIRKTEYERIISRISERSFVILLDERGKEMDSMAFAEKLSSFQDHSRNVCFIIAGSLGAHVLMKEHADLKLSLSRMTFSHQIIRPLFFEQLYRAFTIIRNEPYHNEG